MAFRPLIAVFGTTGVGKSNLAIELALHLARSPHRKGARIINADAMQVYAGLDVLTNKVSETEQQGIPHLLMGFKQPGEQYVVGQWVKDAIDAIDEAHRNQEIPIVVGGTSYWMQHLMFPDRLSGMQRGETPPMSESIIASLATLPPELLNLFNSLPPQPPDAALDPDGASALHALLKHLDPQIAARWHWKDTRKVFRSLSILKETGRRPSEIVNEQSENVLKSRYNTLCFWLYAEPSALHPRLDERVDQMLGKGLLDEVRSLQSLSEADYTLGIYQSIGYREFHQYLSTETPTDKLFKEAVENMKVSTWQYAKRQISWIKNKLLPAVRAADVPTYLLDATDLDENWTVNVRELAVSITDKFLRHIELPNPSILSQLAATMLFGSDKPVAPTAVLNAQRKIICETCTTDSTRPIMIDEDRMTAHQQARTHRRLARRMTPEQHRAAQYSKRAARHPPAESAVKGESEESPMSLFA
ncbi:tRNA dimethylallyltransferase [Mycena indigotica]|uniref:tRNA dimethylallyltransferase n=1 Tax=Mycena indigotica TaxID=2126181 RepID=A0A8H6SA45_9AGAR|nr:tRNA dimethylallyltransferase [Mycena indigotica]KAF7295177.1 tRNA dimethylallyltransferase [Mycena indigotica]